MIVPRDETSSCNAVTELEALKREILTTLKSFTGRYATCAMVDFPNHGNVGDNAIWLGELEVLKQLGTRVVYACDAVTYRAAALRKLTGDGLILIHGGGNFGNLYARHQLLRERVLQDFPDNEIVQLPQTVWFTDDGASDLDRARRVIARHRRFTILVRDRVSQEFARQAFQAEVRLCPDMAFALGPRRRLRDPVADVVILGRTDGEAKFDWARAGQPMAGDLDVRVVDWFGIPWGMGAPSVWSVHREKMVARSNNWVERLQRRVPFTPPGPVQAYLARQWTLLAEARVRDGLALLSGGKTVVTDRLHAHIFCILLGMPHVVLDNTYGKVRAVHDAWTSNFGLARWARDPKEALEVAAEIIAQSALPSRP